MTDVTKKVCLVTTGLGTGGAETQVVALAIELKQRGWDVDIVSMLPPLGFVEKLQSAGICVHDLNMRRGVGDPLALFRLASLLRRLQPAVIHAHMIHANLLARLARLFCAMPVLVCTAHSVNEGGRLREMAYRFTDFNCDLTSQICQAGMDRYISVKAVPSNKIRYIPNGIDVGCFFPDAAVRTQVRRDLGVGAKFVWLAVATFCEPKDHPNLIRAFGQACAHNPEALLLLVGDGPLRSDIESLVASLGLAGSVRFLGTRRDISAIMNGADAYVMSSKLEGLPLVLLEASASGLPILATQVGGIPEVVQDGVSGVLVPAENSEKLACGMSSMMGFSAQELKRMGENGKAFTNSHYSLSAVVDQWEALYRELLEKNGCIIQNVI